MRKGKLMYMMNYIDKETLEKNISSQGKSTYGSYLKKL